MLIEGWPYFYKVILSFLMLFKKEILNESDFPGVLTILKSQSHVPKYVSNSKEITNLNWNELFNDASKLEIDNYFVYKMHSNYDNDTQRFKLSFSQQ